MARPSVVGARMNVGPVAGGVGFTDEEGPILSELLKLTGRQSELAVVAIGFADFPKQRALSRPGHCRHNQRPDKHERLEYDLVGLNAEC